jgi:hypothetical protein
MAAIGPDTAPVESRNAMRRARLLTLADLDRRTAAARRARDLVSGLESDLGGSDRLTVAERQLVQRAAVLGAIIEHYEALWLDGRPINVNEHLASINAQRRCLEAVGLRRVPRDITPDPLVYAQQRAADEDALPHQRVLEPEIGTPGLA